MTDWQRFCSSRGVGLTDFAKEPAWRPKSLVLETDPPLHDRTRRVLNRVLSASVMRELRERFAADAETLVQARWSSAARSTRSPTSPRRIVWGSFPTLWG